ncbi:hypothetical protein KA047_00265 [Candidatus Saccharibacteria bacterium]|nr:hypothetical protein [Candidatus Saccharibacteria bacterium]
MELSERLTQLTQIQAARQAIEAQRPVLGDVIDGTLADIDSRISSLLPPAPTEEQLKAVAGWNTVLEQLAELEMAPPEPNETVLDALNAVNEYAHVTEVFQSLGAVSLASTEADSPRQTESLAPAPAPAPKRPRQRSRRASSTPPKPEPAVAEPETQPAADPAAEEVQHAPVEQEAASVPPEAPAAELPLPEAIGKVVITDGEREREITRVHKDITVAILKALQESPDGTVETTELHRKLVGVSSREIQLHINGARLIDDPTFNVAEARNRTRHFYKALKELRTAHYVEHIPGSLGAGNGINKNKSGLIKAHSDILITANEEGDVRVEMQPRPHHLAIDLYRQSIDNGRGQTHIFEKDPRKFEKIARTLGFLATKSESETARFTRAKLHEWLPDVTGSDQPSLSALSLDLKSVGDKFEDDFPLLQKGTRGGAYFTWDSRAEVEVVGGFPEKPNFEDAVHVRIVNGSVYITINDVEQPLFDYATKTPAFTKGIIDKETVLKRQAGLFAALSAIEATDVMDVQQLLSLMPEEDIHENSLSNWIYNVIDRLNGLAGEVIVNRRHFGTMLFDLNRRIIVDEVTDDSSTEVDAVPVDTPTPAPEDAVDQVLTPPSSPEDPGEEPSLAELPAADPEEVGVAPRRTALQLIEDTNNLDERSKMILRRRLTQDGRFEFPKKLEHAVYLLQLVADNTALAELCETDRFRHSEASYYENFLAELLLACYFRTMTWGDFGSLVQAVRQTAPESVTMSADNVLHTAVNTSFNVDDMAPQDAAHRATERAKLDTYLTKALDDFKAGVIPDVSTPIQAVGLLDHFRVNRQFIAEGKTQREFDQLVEALQVACYDVLGKGNLLSMLDFRTPARTSGGQRAVLTATGEERQLTRTDTHRYPDVQPRRRRRRRG